MMNSGLEKPFYPHETTNLACNNNKFHNFHYISDNNLLLCGTYHSPDANTLYYYSYSFRDNSVHNRDNKYFIKTQT
jgi:hypothetical protein